MVRFILLRHTLAIAVALLAPIAPLATPARAADTGDATLLGALGLTAAAGETKLEGDAGTIETWLLTSGALDVAAQAIKDTLEEQPGGMPAAGEHGRRNYILVGPDEQLDLAAPAVLRSRIVRLQGAVDKLHCAAAAEGFFEPQANGLKMAPSDIAGALKTDVIITGIKIDPKDRTLINALAAKSDAGIAFYTRSDLVKPTGSALVEAWDKLGLDVEQCRADPANQKAAPVAQYDALAKLIETPSESTGDTRLERAATLDALPDAKILRVSIEQAGGTAMVRSNIWYKLGFPGAAVLTGGLVVSFRAADPTTGQAERAAIISCAYPLRRFQSITREPGPAPAATCWRRSAIVGLKPLGEARWPKAPGADASVRRR